MRENFTAKIKWLSALLLLSSTMAWAQNREISGKVTSSEDRSGLPGVNILEKGTSNGTVSDANGDYKISVKDNATLAFSFIGFKTVEIGVGSQTAVNVTLESDVTALAEVVVVGYGQQEKKDVTGSVIAVSTKDFNKGIISSPQDMLVGKVAGVQITSNNGAPGSGSTIRIRGNGSALASQDPLIVIDGFPIDNQGATGSSSQTAGMSNPLATLNPNDIESFTVLKDASATAIYGLRASNGVIIITTKKGKEGKPTFNYNANVSVSSPVKYYPVLTGDEMRSSANDLLNVVKLSGLTQKIVNRLGTANTDWQREVYQTAISNDHNLSVSGSYKNLPYRVSYGFTDQAGILKTTNFTRNSLNINLTPTFLDGDLLVTATMKGMNTQQNFGNTGAVGSSVSFDPTQPVFNDNTRWGGYFTWVGTADTLSNGAMNPNGNPITIGAANPVALIQQTDNRSNVYRGIGNLKLEYRLRFFPAIKLTMNAGADYSTSTGHNNAPNNAAFTYGSGLGQRINYTGINRSRLLDLYADYIKEIGGHRIDVTAGYSYQSFERYGTNFARNDPPSGSTNFTDYEVGPDGTTQVPRHYVPNPNYLLSFFGRVNYSYADRYLLTASFRDDASSRFAKQNRFVIFPSVALGWRINKESFMAGVKFLSDLKLRGSYGITGNQDIGSAIQSLGSSQAQNISYPYLALYQQSTATAQYQFGNNFVNTLRPQAYDANIKWETTAQADIGMDFGFLNNRITGSVDWYQKKTTNLINQIPVPLGSNFSNYLFTNVGNLENKGIEVALRAQVVKTSDFEWNFGFNASHNQNKVTKLLKTNDPTYPGILTGGISGGVGTTIQNIQVGYPIYSFLVYQQVYNPQNRPLEGVYVDVTGNGGQITANNLNKIRYHKPQPDYLLGVNSRFNYKQWDFYFSGRVSFGNYVYNNNLSSKAFYSSNFYNQAGFFNNVPTRIHDTEFINPQYYSSYYVENASFFKMDNMSLGYSVGQLFTQKLKARFSLTVQNAFIVTKYHGLDPEVDGGIDNNIYPRPRVFMVGMNLSY